jgi:outer membrane autotransporter protein
VKKINKSLMGMAIMLSSISPNYAGNDESPGRSTAKSPRRSHAEKNISSPPGSKTSYSYSGNRTGVARPSFKGQHAEIDKGLFHGGAGFWLNKASNSSIGNIKAKGGDGIKGGNGIFIDKCSDNINLDNITVQGGSVIKTSAKSFEGDPVGGAGIFIADGHATTKFTINNTTITGGQGRGYLAGKGMDIRGPADIILNNCGINSGTSSNSNGTAADGITMESGSLILNQSVVKSNGAAGIYLSGPALAKVLSPSEIDGGFLTGVGIRAKDECQVEVSGKVSGKEYAVSFEGDNNTLTLEKNYQLKGKLKSLGKNNTLNLRSQDNDGNRFYLSSLAAVNESPDTNSNNIGEDHKEHPGFSLHKTGAGHWTLYDQNPNSRFEQVTVSEGSLSLAEVNSDQAPRHKQANGEPPLGQAERIHAVQAPIVDIPANLYSKEIHIKPGATFGGCGLVQGQVQNGGTLVCGSPKNSVPASGYLLIDGSYQGVEGSSVEMDVHLRGDDVMNNKLLINGVVSGRSKVKVIPHVGTETSTNDIPLIKVIKNNALATDAFYLSEPVIIGGIERYLKQENNQWLLTTEPPGTQSPLDEQPMVVYPVSAQAIEHEVKHNSPPAKPPRRKAMTANEVLVPSPSAPSPTAALQHPGAQTKPIRQDADREDKVVKVATEVAMNVAETVSLDSANFLDGKPLITTEPLRAESNLAKNYPGLEIITAAHDLDDYADTNQPSSSAADGAPFIPVKVHHTAQEIVYEASPHAPVLMPLIKDVQPIAQHAILSDIPESIPVASAVEVDLDQDGETGADAAATDFQPEIHRAAATTASATAPVIIVVTEPEQAFAEEETDVTASENPTDNDTIVAIEAESAPLDELPSPATASVTPLPIAAEYSEPLLIESGIFAANLSAANTMLTTRMHDRLGNPAYPEAWGYDNASGRPALWLRTVGSSNTSAMSAGGNLTQTHLQRVQLGGEIFHATRNGADGWHLGLMAGQGKSHSKTRSTSNGDDAKGGISGYAMGVYGTWHRDDEQRKGLYLDGSLNYNWFDNRVRDKTGTEHHYRSHGMVGSVETGYHQKWHQGKGYRAYIQPQAQLTWMGVRAEQAVINEQTLSSRGSDNLQSRLGARVYIEHRAEGRQLIAQPYIETSWIHNSRPFGVEFNGHTQSQQGSTDIAEFKIGHEGQISRDVALWGSLAHQLGGGNYRNTAGTLGVTIRF